MIGKTSYFLKLPHVNPSAQGQHAANARELERWANNLPTSGLSEVDSGTDTATSLPFEASVALPSTGSWLVTGTTFVKWPNNPAGGAFLVQTGFSFDAGSGLISSVEQAGAWDEALVSWSFVHVAGSSGNPPYAVVGSHYAIDAIGTPDEVTISARWYQIA